MAGGASGWSVVVLPGRRGRPEQEAGPHDRAQVGRSEGHHGSRSGRIGRATRDPRCRRVDAERVPRPLREDVGRFIVGDRRRPPYAPPRLHLGGGGEGGPADHRRHRGAYVGRDQAAVPPSHPRREIQGRRGGLRLGGEPDRRNGRPSACGMTLARSPPPSIDPAPRAMLADGERKHSEVVTLGGSGWTVSRAIIARVPRYRCRAGSGPAAGSSIRSRSSSGSRVVPCMVRSQSSEVRPLFESAGKVIFDHINGRRLRHASGIADNDPGAAQRRPDLLRSRPDRGNSGSKGSAINRSEWALEWHIATERSKVFHRADDPASDRGRGLGRNLAEKRHPFRPTLDAESHRPWA